MSYGLVGAYAIYFILVGINGNSSKLVTLVERDGKGFLVWILAILILRALYNVDTLRPLVKPFIALAILTFVLKNWNNVATQLNEILPQYNGKNLIPTAGLGTTAPAVGSTPTAAELSTTSVPNF